MFGLLELIASKGILGEVGFKYDRKKKFSLQCYQIDKEVRYNVFLRDCSKVLVNSLRLVVHVNRDEAYNNIHKKYAAENIV